MLVLFLMVSALPVRACLMLELFLMVSLYLTCSLIMVTTVVRACLMLELFLMVTTIPDMLPHDGDHCGKGLSDIGAVSDGLHSPLYLTCSLMMVTTVVRASMMLVLFLMVSARSLSTSSATAFLFRYT